MPIFGILALLAVPTVPISAPISHALAFPVIVARASALLIPGLGGAVLSFRWHVWGETKFTRFETVYVILRNIHKRLYRSEDVHHIL